MTSMEDERWVYWRMKAKILEDENRKLKQELFESKKDYLIEAYSDNPTRRDEKIQGLKEEFKERFGGFDD